MTNRIKAILTALLIMAMAGSAMCAPTGLPEQAATQAELKAIDAIQKAIDEKGYNWTAGVTSVSGLTDDEKKKLCGLKLSKDQKDKVAKEKKPHPKKLDPVGTYPSTFDWRNVDGEDWMTPVRNQGSCGSCWAFCAIGVVEAAINIYANNPNLDIDLSEQHLVSGCCSAGDCDGGCIGDALTYTSDIGVTDETCFPYIAQDCACTPCANWENNTWRIVSRNFSYPMSKESIISNGPSSGAIRVYADFFSYTGGVYQRTSNVFIGNHAIVVVGWNDTEGCWIIKNSWGTDWGEDGYCRLPGEHFIPATGGYTVDGIMEHPYICPCELYDTNGEPGIQEDEVLNAIADYYDGLISLETMNIVIACQQGPCDIYDTNGTPGIQVDEVLNAIGDYYDGLIDVDTMNAVIACYNA